MRVFIAVEISELEILNKIQTFQNELKINAKPTRIDQIHFTLQFLGEIEEDKCEQVKDVFAFESMAFFVGSGRAKAPSAIFVGSARDLLENWELH